MADIRTLNSVKGDKGRQKTAEKLLHAACWLSAIDTIRICSLLDTYLIGHLTVQFHCVFLRVLWYFGDPNSRKGAAVHRL